jgi:hypothetical protein
VPEKDYCCEECFEHPWLRMTARENRIQLGCCFYCGTQGWLAPVRVLHAGFSNLLSEYIPAEAANGGRDSYFPSEPPLRAIQRDWKLFSQQFISKASTCFLPAVFRDQPAPTRLGSFTVPVVAFHRNAMSTAYDKWLAFWVVDDRLLSEWDSRRPSPDVQAAETFIDRAAEHLQPFVRSLPSGKKLWRARAGYLGVSNWDCRPFRPDQMGSHPEHPASRLNHTGEAVLYCAEDEKTAVSEIRPGKGYICTTCELTLTKKIQALDLASSPEDINPFTCINLSWKLDLRRIGRNLSALIGEPTSRGEDKALYRKTQLLGQIVRTMQLKGVRFSSSLNSPTGVNLALFDPVLVTFSNTCLVKVTKTEVAYERLHQSNGIER